MKDWTTLAEKPGYKQRLFMAWVWSVEKTCGYLFRKAVVEASVRRIGGGMDKVPIFKEKEGRGEFGELVPEPVLSCVHPQLVSKPASSARVLMKKYDIIEAILSDRTRLLTQVKLVFTALFNRYQPPSTSSQPLLQCAATPIDPRCDALVFFSMYRKLSELSLLPWNTIEDLVWVAGS